MASAAKAVVRLQRTATGLGALQFNQNLARLFSGRYSARRRRSTCVAPRADVLLDLGRRLRPDLLEVGQQQLTV
eukprot:14036881-Alexandrium_andersonii.AAC.1